MRSLNNRSIRTNLVLLVLLIWVPLFAILFYSSYEQKQRTLKYASDNAIGVARNLALQQNFVAENTRQLLGLLADIPTIRYSNDSIRKNFILRSLLEDNPSYAVLLQVNNKGDLMASSMGLAKINVSDRKYFKDALRTKTFSVGEYSRGRLTQKPVLHYAYPILGTDGSVQSILIASFDLNYYNSVFNNSNLGNDAALTFVDHKGTILYHSPNIALKMGSKIPDEIFTNLNKEQEGTFIAHINDTVEHLFGYYNIKLLDDSTYMTIYVGIPLKNAISQFQEALTKYFLVWTVLGLILIIFAYFFAKKAIVKPVDSIVDTARLIAAGNLEVRTGIKKPSSELGKLARAIDEMTEKLQLREFERYRAEKELKKLKERFELAVNSAKIGIWDWHIRKNSLIWDQNMFELYELDPMKFSNQMESWETLIHPDDLPQFKLDIEYAVENVIPFRSEFRIKTNYKSVKHIRIFADVILDKEMKPIRLIGVNWDISERKGIEKRINQAREKAETNDKLKSSFLANISHEIRTPIHGIIGFAQILKNAEIPEAERKQYLDIIIGNGNNLMDVVSNIIDISMLDSGQLKLLNKNCQLNTIIKDVYHSYVSIKINENKNFNFILDVDCEADIEFFGDEYRIKQVISNLLDNAFKFTSVGEVRMGYYCTETEYVFYIKDTGIGIKKEFVARVFDRFKQLDEGYDRNYSGNGLGLSICKGLVELMGGKIWLQQNAVHGSEFYFSIPISPDVKFNSIAVNKNDHFLN